VVEYAHGTPGAIPPPELSLYWLCNRFGGALPESGPLFDQDAILLTRMGALDNIYRVVSRYINMPGAAIHQLATHERLILRDLVDEGIRI